MRRPRRVAALCATTAAMMAAAFVPQVTATATPSSTTADPGSGNGSTALRSDLKATGPDFNGGKAQKLDAKSMAAAKQQVNKQNKAALAGDHAVGDQLNWLAEDDTTGQIYLKSFTLRGLGDHIQVWVADDTAFPEGDCRNDLGLADITDTQVNSFVTEFDTNIYPKESASFSVAPSLDGSDSPLGGDLGDPDYYKVSADQADDIVTLVDNVKDANYYDPSTPDGQTYIAGFFYSVFNAEANRNIMTIDAFDWLHRTGATPPDNSADAAYVACAQSQGQAPGRAYGASRPRLYEGTFAHEYQHLLESYEDPDEVSWVNEGLSDYAQSLVGYVDTSTPPDDPTADNHIASFAGFLGTNFGGPENSLTSWQDQGAPEILADYGAAYSFMMYLFDRYGEDFMSALHRENAGGLPGLDKVLDKFKSTYSAKHTLRDWAAAMALDNALDKSLKPTVDGGKLKDYVSSSLSGLINWDNPQAYDTPGAPPNGSDYVRLRGSDGSYLNASQVRSVEFKGDKSLAPRPVEWTSTTTAPDATTPATSCGNVPTGTTGPALYSGCGESLDRSIVRTVHVNSTGSKLRFKTLFDTEEDWDFGFVQVSTDGGKTYTSLPATDTTTKIDPGADPTIASMLPGFSGDSLTWKDQTVNLGKYAGKDVVLGFRYKSDTSVNEGGFWVKDITASGQALPSTLDGWKSMTQQRPIPVSGYTVQLVAYDQFGHATYSKMALSSSFTGKADNAFSAKVAQLQATARASAKAAAKAGDPPIVVAALVMQDDPTESIAQQAGYQLLVNGVLQPGGVVSAGGVS